MESLPDEILLEILSYLSRRELMQCGAVSRRWRHLSRDISLWQIANFSSCRIVSLRGLVNFVQSVGVRSLNLQRSTIEDPLSWEAPSDPNQLEKINLSDSNISPRDQTGTESDIFRDRGVHHSLQTAYTVWCNHFAITCELSQSPAISLNHLFVAINAVLQSVYTDSRSDEPLLRDICLVICLKTFSHLKSIILRECNIDENASEYIAANTQLRVLDLRSCKSVSPTFYKKVFSGCQSLEILDLSHIWNLYYNLKFFKSTSLRRVRVVGCNLSFYGIRSPFYYACETLHTELDFGHESQTRCFCIRTTPCRACDVKNLLRNCPNVTHIDISSNNVGPLAVDFLKKYFPVLVEVICRSDDSLEESEGDYATDKEEVFTSDEDSSSAPLLNPGQ